MDTEQIGQDEIEARFKAMATQRNNALDECVFLAAQREILLARCAALKQEVSELKAKLPAEVPTSEGGHDAT